MASTTRSGTKYNRLHAGQRREAPSDTGSSFNLDQNTESAGVIQCVQQDDQALEYNIKISTTHVAHSTDDHVDFEYDLSEASIETDPDRTNGLKEVALNFYGEFSKIEEEQKIIQSHSDQDGTKHDSQEKSALTPEQISRIQQNRNIAMERLAKRNAEQISPATKVEVINGMIKNQNKSRTCAYSEIVTPDKDFRMMVDASHGDIASCTTTLNLLRGQEQITLTPTQSIRIERNRLDALKRLKMK